MEAKIFHNDQALSYESKSVTGSNMSLLFDGKLQSLDYTLNQNTILLKFEDGTKLETTYVQSHQTTHIFYKGEWFAFNFSKIKKRRYGGDSDDAVASATEIMSPMPGRIIKLLVSMGNQVQKDQPLLIIEAMKMEHVIKASQVAEVAELFFAEGDQVTKGALLLKFCEAEEVVE